MWYDNHMDNTDQGDQMQELEYYTVDELAAMLRVDPRTILRLINIGELPALKVGRGHRIHKDDVQLLRVPA